MIYYQALVHKDADSSYGVSFPDLEGCFSAGETLQEATENASEALQLYLGESADIPEPQAIDALILNNEIKAELAAGAVLVAVPYIDLGAKPTRFNVSFDRNLLQAVDQTRGQTNRSAWLASAALAALNIKPTHKD